MILQAWDDSISTYIHWKSHKNQPINCRQTNIPFLTGSLCHGNGGFFVAKRLLFRKQGGLPLHWTRKAFKVWLPEGDWWGGFLGGGSSQLVPPNGVAPFPNGRFMAYKIAVTNHLQFLGWSSNKVEMWDDFVVSFRWKCGTVLRISTWKKKHMCRKVEKTFIIFHVEGHKPNLHRGLYAHYKDSRFWKVGWLEPQYFRSSLIGPDTDELTAQGKPKLRTFCDKGELKKSYHPNFCHIRLEIHPEWPEFFLPFLP